MKKKRFLIFVLLACVAIASYASTAVISGEIKGKNLFQSVNFYLISNDFITTSPISPDGKFEIKAEIPTKECYYLLFTGTNGLKRQQIIVVAPGDNISMTIESSYLGNKLVSVSGSEDLALIKKYLEKQAQFTSSEQSLGKAYEAAEAADRPAIKQQYTNLYQEYSKDLESVLVKNKNLLASIYIEFVEFSKDQKAHVATFKTLYDALKPKYGETLVVKEVEYYVSNPIDVGKVAPELEGKSPDGRTIKLSDFRGKYVLVDFWASWCRPCRAENPNVVMAYNKYKDKKFVILSVSLDSDAASWKNAIEAGGLIWSSHISSLQRWSCPLARKYRVQSIPYSILVGPDGKIVATQLRGEALQKTLSELIK